MPEGRSPPQHEQPVLGPGGPHVVEMRVDGVELDVHQDHHVGLQTLEAVDGGVDDAVRAMLVTELDHPEVAQPALAGEVRNSGCRLSLTEGYSVTLGRLDTERFDQRFRVFLRNSQQSTGRTFRVAPTLLPVPKGSNADTDHHRKLRLGFAELLPDGLDICRTIAEDASWLDLLSPDLPSLPDTGHQLIEILLLQCNSSRTA